MIDEEKAYKACTEALAHFVNDAGFEDVIIGLSGGIDSSLVAVMAADALGSQHVHGLMLPGPYSSTSSVEDAEELAKRNSIEYKIVSIDEPYKAFAKVLAAAMDEALGGLAAENTQARCRMICIMAVSNARGWMMLNTGNASEAAMGYSTLYGDTAGAFAPIGGLYKTEVYALARWRNAMATANGQVPPIPENVLLKAPSAELAPNQIDEASMGIDYKTLDEILISCNENGATIEQMSERGYRKSQVASILNRYNSYGFKRDLEPPFPSLAHIRSL